MKKDHSKTESLQRFIDLISSRFPKIEVLCLDRVFYLIDVLNFLEEKKIPYIVPVVKRGNKINELLKVSHS
jgi:putative transposase